jgi:hypothetical protein
MIRPSMNESATLHQLSNDEPLTDRNSPEEEHKMSQKKRRAMLGLIRSQRVKV